ncbi:MAG: DUF6531 domain-containing protein [Planctomycetota bacterium]
MPRSFASRPLALLALALGFGLTSGGASTPQPAPPEPVTIAAVQLSNPPASLESNCTDCPPSVTFPSGPTVPVCHEGVQAFPLQNCLPGGGSPPMEPPPAGGGGGGSGGAYACACWHIENHFPLPTVPGGECGPGCSTDAFCTTSCMPVPFSDTNMDGVSWPDDSEEPGPGEPGWTYAADPAWGDTDGDSLPNAYDIFPEGPEGPMQDGLLPNDFMTPGGGAREFFESLEQMVGAEPPIDPANFPDPIPDLGSPPDGQLTLGEAVAALLEVVGEHAAEHNEAYEGMKVDGRMTPEEQEQYRDFVESLQEVNSLGDFGYSLLQTLGADVFGDAYEEIESWLENIIETTDQSLSEMNFDIEGVGGNVEVYRIRDAQGSHLTAKFLYDEQGVNAGVEFYDENGDQIDPEGVGEDSPFKNVVEWLSSVFGDPVSTASGAFLYDHTDLVIPGRGPTLEIKRHYSSRSPRRGILGHGWTMPLLETYLLVWPSADGFPGVLQIAWGDGTVSTFRADPDDLGLWLGVDGEFGKVRALQSQGLTACDVSNNLPGFVYRAPDGQEFHFCPPVWVAGLGRGSVGWLRAVSDPYGNAILFRRNGFGDPYEIVDTLGRMMTLEYYEDPKSGLLKSITDWTGREITYDYDSHGDLVSVELPEALFLDDGDALQTGRHRIDYTYDEDPDGFDEYPGSALNHNLLTVAHDGAAPRVTISYVTETGYSFDKVRSHDVGGEVTEYRYLRVDEGASPWHADVRHTTSARRADGSTERFHHGESGLLYAHEVVNGKTDAETWTLASDVYSNPDESFVNSVWFTTYDYDDEYRLLSIVEGGDGHADTRGTAMVYDSANPDRSAQRNVLMTVRTAEAGSGLADRITTYAYDPITNQPRLVVDELGRSWTRTFAHQELTYEDARDHERLHHWRMLPDPDVDPVWAAAVEPLFGLGDVNQDGVLGGGFEPIRFEEPELVIAAPDGPEPSGGSTTITPTSLAAYDQHGGLVTLVDEEGMLTTIEWGGGHPVVVIDDDGGLDLTTELTWGALSRATGERLPDGREREIDYDARDNLIELRELPAAKGSSSDSAPPLLLPKEASVRTDGKAIVRRAFYDLAGRTVGVSPASFAGGGDYAAGLTPRLDLRATYDVADRLATLRRHVYDGGGAVLDEGTWTYEYDPAGNLIEETTPLGATLVSTFDTRGHALSVERRAGSTSFGTRTFDFDTFGAPTHVRTPLGHATRMEYDGFGQLASQLSPLGRETTFVVDEAGRVLEENVESGTLASTKYEYDSRDRITAVSRKNLILRLDGSVEASSPAWVREERGWGAGPGRLLWRVVDPSGLTRLVRHRYDSAGRRTEIWHGAADEVGLVEELDPAGRPVARTFHMGGTGGLGAPALSRAWLHHDRHGRLLYDQAPTGGVTQTIRDASGFVALRIDPKGREERFSLDSRGGARLQVEVDPQGLPDRSVARDFDVEGNLELLTDARSHQTRFTWDELGRRTGRIFHDGSAETLTYDDDDRLDLWSYPGGRVWDYGYDAGGRLTSLIASGPELGVTRTLGYDALDRANVITDTVSGSATVFTRREHTSLGALVRDETQVAGEAPRVFTAEVDATGAPLRVTYPSQLRVRRDRDALGRLAGLVREGPLPTSIATFPDPWGLSRFHRAVLGASGAELIRDHDAAGRRREERIVNSGGQILQGFHLNVDLASNPIQRTDLESGCSERFEYDGFRRLVRWDFDLENLLGGGRTVTWNWDPADNLTLLTDTLTPGGATGSYDALNRLDGFAPLYGGLAHEPTGEESYHTEGAAQLNLTYDALGRPGSVVRTDASGTSLVSYAFDGLDRIASVSDSELGATRYGWFGGALHESLSPTAHMEYAPGFDEHTPLWRLRDNAEELYVFVDHAGNVSGLTDGYQLVESYRYDPFGQPRESATPLAVSASSIGNDLFFQARPFDLRSGYALLGTRQLDTQACRFVARDPLGEAAGLNLYSYARANPLRWTDPTGLAPEDTPGESPIRPNWSPLFPDRLEGSIPQHDNPIAVMDAIVQFWSPILSDGIEGSFADLSQDQMQEVLETFDAEHSFGEHESIDRTLEWVHDGLQHLEALEMLDTAAAFLDPIGTAVEAGLTAVGVDEDIAAGVGFATGVVATGGTKLLTKGAREGGERLLARGGTNPLKGTRYTDKVRRQMEPNPRTGRPDHHGFPREVDNYAGDGTQTTIRGEDGIDRTQVELPGSLNGRDGVFEWLIEPGGTVNHRLFRPNQQ